MRSSAANSHIVRRCTYSALVLSLVGLAGCVGPPAPPTATGEWHFINGEVMGNKEYWQPPPKRAELSPEDIQPVQPRPDDPDEAFTGARP